MIYTGVPLSHRSGRKKRDEVGSVVFSLIALGALGYFIKMGLNGNIIAAIPAVFSLVILAHSGAPFISGFIGRKSGSLFTGGDRFEETPLLSEAKSTANDGNYEGAAKKYRAELEKFPEVLIIYRELFVLYQKMGKPEEMREVYKKGYMIFEGEKKEKLVRIFQEESKNGVKL